MANENSLEYGRNMMEISNVHVPIIKMKAIYKGLPLSELLYVNSSNTIVQVLRKLFNQDTFLFCEEFIVLYLNRNNKLIGARTISYGGAHGIIVDVKTVYSTAVLLPNVSAVVLAHNHPSGNCVPSNEDNTLTQRMVQAGMILDIKVIDHVILTDTNYYSYSDEGKLNY